MPTSQEQALAVADWRRRVHRLYADVQAARSPEQAHTTWVAGRSSLFAWHPASPRREGQAMRHAAYDPAMRFTLPLLPADDDVWVYDSGTDGAVPFARVGAFDVPGVGRLDVWWLESYGGGLFVPVKDPSPETYGAGRYVLDTVKGADLGRVGEDWVLDLNFAYNPSCVYDPAWACPLAPAGNLVDTPLPVGELLPDGR
ncbi:MAG TPA: DUF1684 domain-containing protein [Nocardioides sp.]